MAKIQFKDAFREVFKDKLKVTESIVLDTCKNPTKKENLENNITLFLKEFDNNHLTHLLVATQNVNNEELFAFSYWIPKQLLSIDISLIDILEIFANSFGCKVKIAENEAYFFRKTRKSIQGKLESPDQIMEILGSVHIPSQSYLFFKENVDNNINWVDCYCCFAINNNKYLIWLYNIETNNIKVKPEWYIYLTEIRDILNPFGTTGLTILSGKKEKSGGLISYRENTKLTDTEMELEIPKYYFKTFTRINEIVSELNGNEKIAIIPKFENNKCVFCGSENTNREHLFAVWMRKYFLEKTFSSNLHSRLPEENLLNSLNSGLSKGSESSYGYTTHKVCVECNGTWMSQLEEKVKSILTNDSTTLNNTISSLDLNEYNSNQLALWVTVKAILLSIKNNLTPVLPRNTMEDLKRGAMTNGFLVEIAECETYDLNFIANKGVSALGSLLRLKVMDKVIANDLTKDFFMVSIQIGNFLFRVSYFDETKGLKREACIRPTAILYPYGYKMPYLKIDNEQERWEEVEGKLKLYIFNIGLSLTDN